MRLPLFIATIAALLVMSSTTMVGAAAPRIKEMSHSHPAGANHSFVCAHVKGKPGKRMSAVISGPAVIGEERQTFRFPRQGQKRGKFTLVWPIASPGNYELSLRKRGSRAVVDRDTYFVPGGAPAHGPFECPATSRKGWA